MKTIEQRIADMEAQLAQLKEEAKASADEWPKDGDSFYYIGSIGVYHDVWNGLESGKYKLETGNVFLTREEANLGLERRKVLTELRKLAKASWGGTKIDWTDDTKYKWQIRFAHDAADGGKFDAINWRAVQYQSAVAFATQEAAQAAIETIGADRLMLLLED